MLSVDYRCDCLLLPLVISLRHAQWSKVWQKELVLVSHGRFCEELKVTRDDYGTTRSIHTVAPLPEGGGRDLSQFEATVRCLEDYIVFTDLFGRNSCNTVEPFDP